MKAITYRRVSSLSQKEDKTIVIQQDALNEYAKKNSIDVIGDFSDDGISGAEWENRPGLCKMLDYIESNKVDAILIYKLDRLSRNLYGQEHLIKKFDRLKIKLISITEPDLCSDDPMRKAFRQFMGIVAELEKSFIAMRMKAGRDSVARKGKHAGGRVATGYKKVNGDLKITCPDAVKDIFVMRKTMSLRQIASEMNKRDQNRRWHPSTVNYILKNKIYNGVLKHGNITSERPDLVIMEAK